MRIVRTLPLLALLLAQVAWARPTVRIRDEKPLKSGNVGDTFLARAEGRVWFFKADGPIGDIQRYGNFEAEMLVSRLFRRVGVRAPQARLVNIAGRRGAFLQTELVDPAFTGGVKPVELKKGFSGLDVGTVDLTELRLLQVMDVLIGNGDRHDGNLFLIHRRGRTDLVPIDNNLALATPRVVYGYYNWHLTPDFDGVVAGKHPEDPGGMLYPVHAPASGKPLRAMLRNRLYQRGWSLSGRTPEGLSEYVRLATRVKALLPDGVLEQIVGELADEDVTTGDPAARKAEILRLLKRRRDALPDAFRDLVREQDARPRVGLQWLERSLPERIRKRLPVGENDLAYLGARMFAAESFRPREAYYHLRAVGVDKLLARECVKHLCEAQGVDFPTKQILLSERGFQASTYPRAVEEFFRSFPTGKFRRLHGDDAPQDVPLDLVAVVPGRKSITFRDARGRELDRDKVRPLFGAIKAALREGRPRLGEVVLLERDAFTPGVYRASVEGPGGKARWSGRVSVRARPAR